MVGQSTRIFNIDLMPGHSVTSPTRNLVFSYPPIQINVYRGSFNTIKIDHRDSTSSSMGVPKWITPFPIVRSAKYLSTAAAAAAVTLTLPYRLTVCCFAV